VLTHVTESAPQSGNIRYTVVRQAFKWQQNGNSAATDWQHIWLAGLVLFAGTIPNVVLGTQHPHH
jgi:hypothetical protein